MHCLPMETLVERNRRLANRWGQFTDLVVFDPHNRGSQFVEDLLRKAGLVVEVQDEGPEVVISDDQAGTRLG